jgi:hypothetical protein
MTRDEFLARLEGVNRTRDRCTARCPAHKDRHASLVIGEGTDGRVLVHCFAGCTATEITAAVGVELRDLFPEGEGGRSIPSRTPATVQHPPGCTLAAYSEAKRLPVEFLESIGLSEITYMKHPAVRMPYSDAAGNEICVRFRVGLNGGVRIKAKAGSKLYLYGLDRGGHALATPATSC